MSFQGKKPKKQVLYHILWAISICPLGSADFMCFCLNIIAILPFNLPFLFQDPLTHLVSSFMTHDFVFSSLFIQMKPFPWGLSCLHLREQCPDVRWPHCAEDRQHYTEKPIQFLHMLCPFVFSPLPLLLLTETKGNVCTAQTHGTR